MKQQIKCAHKLPISECREHWIEFCEITGDTIEKRALRWALGNDTGVSSETMAQFMLGIEARQWKSPPSDAADRGRCIRLLKLIPEWLPRLPELAAAGPGEPHTVNGSTEHDDRWSVQIPLILQEGGF